MAFCGAFYGWTVLSPYFDIFSVVARFGAFFDIYVFKKESLK